MNKNLKKKLKEKAKTQQVLNNPVSNNSHSHLLENDNQQFHVQKQQQMFQLPKQEIVSSKRMLKYKTSTSAALNSLLNNMHTGNMVTHENYNIIKKNGIDCFYHFTDISNLPNILKKGLYSRKYLEDNGEQVKYNGNTKSRSYDEGYGTLNDVHLSFCPYYLPMAYHIEKNGNKLVWIKISIDIVKDERLKIRYSDINVASLYAIIKDNVEHIDFNAVKLKQCRRESSEFYKRQAEILVEKHIPLEYIECIIMSNKYLNRYSLLTETIPVRNNISVNNDDYIPF
ncbi:MAG: DUF4433 domain-containing protein [Neisseriaceae bacterium]|nr:DUF4433 domain-containing protein [Neisseriaceae bacterium]